ncbi:DUF4091 domain-containing protein [candidate division CSSED10-310 bacterium]|uniref:DUF4091 domain-containing protein n=1 Tax=candidate division CSSED10-310 bacterium TaxID=2855610 RepID=A0ABV6YZS2_UNCC1
MRAEKVQIGKKWNQQIVLTWSIVFILLFSCDSTTSQVNSEIMLEYGVVKIPPDTIYQGQSTLNLFAARNEYESFQVVLNGPLQDVSVETTSLQGTSGSISATNLILYRVEYLTVSVASNFEGAIGDWPDALIPVEDLFFNEPRNAFPFDVPADENRLVWVDIFVPPGTIPGQYTGTVNIKSNEQLIDTLTYVLTVWNFDIPATSSLPTAFGYEGWDVLRGHYGSSGMHDHYDQIVPFAQMYLESGLMNRITLSSCLLEDWDFYNDPLDWNTIDTRWGSFFEGRNLPFGLQNCRLTSLEIPDIGGSDSERVAFWSDFSQHFRVQDWFYLLFDYTLDEPGDAADYQEIIDRAALIHQADSDLRVLVTTDIQEAASYNVDNVIDIWVPLINFIYGKPYEVCWAQEYVGNQRPDYDYLLAGGAELWWYQSCMSHGCAGSDPNDLCEAGYPSYMVDHSAVRNRIMSWMTYFYDIHGELYFDVNYTDGQGDAWISQFYFGGNGDGTLFYPGRPDMIGGTNHIPIESIRLKLIRDGLEDYEYFLLLEQVEDRTTVLTYLSQMITNAYTYSEDYTTLMDLRYQMGNAISQATPPPVPAFHNVALIIFILAISIILTRQQK